MSLVREWRDQDVAVIGVAIYSRDTAVVKSIAGALKQQSGKDQTADYVVIHQTSLSSMDDVCKASVFDIDMVGASIEKVRHGVEKIRTKQPRSPIFLIGDKAPLVKVMQDAGVKKCVTRTFAKPMLGPKILTALNLTLNSSVKVKPEPAKRSKLSMAVALTLFFAVAAGLAWYLNEKQDAERASNSIASSTAETNLADIANVDRLEPESGVEPNSKALESSSLEPQNSLEPKVNSPELESLESTNLGDSASSLRVEENAGQQFDSASGTTNPLNSVNSDSAVSTATELEQPTQLFNETAENLLSKARSALKRGFIVGPENASALHYYNEALAIDPYHELADVRKQTLVDELKEELDLAMQLAKYGRSKSILKVIDDIDPFNSELASMRQTFSKRFSKPK